MEIRIEQRIRQLSDFLILISEEKEILMDYYRTMNKLVDKRMIDGVTFYSSFYSLIHQNFHLFKI